MQRKTENSEFTQKTLRKRRERTLSADHVVKVEEMKRLKASND